MFIQRIAGPAVVIAGLLAVPAFAQGADSDKPGRFQVAVEQAGKTVAVTNHTVTLQRAPFALVFTLDGVNAVSVSAATSDALLQDARSGKDLHRAFGFTFKAYALSNKNERELLIVEENPNEGFSYLYYDAPENHRFNEVVKNGNRITGRFRVSRIELSGPAKFEGPVAGFPSQNLFLVFALARDVSRGEQQVTDSDYLAIRFAP